MAKSKQKAKKEKAKIGKPKEEAKEKKVKEPKAPKEPKKTKAQIAAEAQESVAKEVQEDGRLRYEVVQDKIKALVDDVERDQMELAELLYESHANAYWRFWGKPDLLTWANEELSIGYRKCWYMISVWATILKAGKNRDELIALGWTKIKDLARVLDENNASEWIEKAEGMSTREVTEAVKKAVEEKPGKEKNAPTKIWTMTVRMEESEASPINDALKDAKAVLSTEKDSEALAYICMDWMQLRGALPESMSLETALKWIGKTFNVKVSAESKDSFTPKTKENPTGKKKTRVVEPENDPESPPEDAAGFDPSDLPDGEEAADVASLLGLKS